MQVREIMTADPACCTADTSLAEVALLMLNNDCGEIPVVDNFDRRQLMGVITDRDIVCRAVAEGKSPTDTAAAEAMTDSVVSVQDDEDIEACCQKMESHQIRRIPVVDAQGGCCGIVAQADIARQASEHETAEVVNRISQPSSST